MKRKILDTKINAIRKIRNNRYFQLVFVAVAVCICVMQGSFIPVADSISANESQGYDIPRQLEDYERVVMTEAELNNALAAEGNNVTHIYLGANITRTAGIHIDSKKPYLIIDGFNPLEPSQTVPYTLTDYANSVQKNTIYLDAAGLDYILIRDIRIVGKNYYGPISLFDYASLASISVIYERVQYDGPEIGYHRQGTIRFIDCDIYIHKNPGGSGSEEVAEAKNLVFEGKNTVISESSTDSAFWIPYGGSLSIADNSTLNLTTGNTVSIYGLIYADATGSVSISVGERAVLDMTIPTFLASNTYTKIKSIEVGTGGSFILRTTQPSLIPVLEMRGDLTVGSGGEFKITGKGGSTQTAILQSSGDIRVGEGSTFHVYAQSAYGRLIRLAGRSIFFNNPASVLLYNKGVVMDATGGNGKIYVEAEQFNYWETLTEGGFEDIPLCRVKKTDGSNLWWEGVVASDKGGKLSSISSNLTAADGDIINVSTIHMGRARVVAFGRLPLTITKILAGTGYISGVTVPIGAVRMKVNQEVYPTVTADSEGIFEMEVDVTTDDVVIIQSYYMYLMATEIHTVQESDAGSLELIVPSELNFVDVALTTKERFVKRVDADWKVMVYDERGLNNSRWKLTVRLIQPFTSTVHKERVLPNMLAWVGGGTVEILDLGETITVYTPQATATDEVTEISWSDDEGLLVYLPEEFASTAYSDLNYTALLEWSINDAP